MWQGSAHKLAHRRALSDTAAVSPSAAILPVYLTVSFSTTRVRVFLPGTCARSRGVLSLAHYQDKDALSFAGSRIKRGLLRGFLDLPLLPGLVLEPRDQSWSFEILDWPLTWLYY